MAFLAPDITAAILSGDQPLNLNLKVFKNDIPLSWTAQRAKISEVMSAPFR
jgi:hypothetical protein